MWFKKKNIKPEIPSRETDTHLRVTLPRLWPYRLIGNLILIGIISAIALGFYIIKTNFVGQKLNSISNFFYEITGKAGFTVDDILVKGRQRTPLKEVINVINLHHGDNIFSPDVHQLQSDLKQLPWVKDAVVERTYTPNIIKINLIERQVQAIWQNDGVLYPVDMDGKVIKTNHLPSVPLLLIGQNAPAHINELLNIVKENPELYKRIKTATYVSNRRWNITFDDVENGIVIKLPAQHMKKAWKKFVKLNKTRGLLKRKLTIIDLRFDNKVIVTLHKSSSGERLRVKNKQEHGT